MILGRWLLQWLFILHRTDVAKDTAAAARLTAEVFMLELG
jgi:hypothetical protein